MADKPELSAFEKFQELMDKLLKVPKREVEREAKKEDALKEKES